MSAEKSRLPSWVNWIAQDADGHWWGYAAEPHQHHQGWYENEVGDCQLLDKDKSNRRWRNTLQRVTRAPDDQPGRNSPANSHHE